VLYIVHITAFCLEGGGRFFRTRCSIYCNVICRVCYWNPHIVGDNAVSSSVNTWESAGASLGCTHNSDPGLRQISQHSSTCWIQGRSISL